MAEKNVTPIARAYTPQQIEAAKAKADERAAEIHADGVQHGLKLAAFAERHKMIMAACVGFIAGTLVAFVVYSMLAQSAMFTTGAVVDRVIARTVADPSLPPALEGRDPSVEYDENAAAAREGCTPGQLMAGRRHCPVAPAERPR